MFALDFWLPKLCSGDHVKETVGNIYANRLYKTLAEWYLLNKQFVDDAPDGELEYNHEYKADVDSIFVKAGKK